jgi:predicted PhzF superfamily epimerase YddE/YHI9
VDVTLARPARCDFVAGGCLHEEENAAAVCLLEEENATAATDELWMQSVVAEFNLSETTFLVCNSSWPAGAAPWFHLRWFTPLRACTLV